MSGGNTAARTVSDAKRPGVDPRASIQEISPPRAAAALAGPSLLGLRPESGRIRQFAMSALPHLRHSNILLPLEPVVERQRLRPASFTNIKGVRRAPILMPRLRPRPAKLVTERSLAKREAYARACAPSVAPAPELRESAAGAGELGPSASREPLWRTLFSEEARRESVNLNAERVSREIYEELRNSGQDWGAAGDVEIAELSASKHDVLIEEEEPTPRFRLWDALESLFLSKAFSRSVAAATCVLLLASLDLPYQDWVRKQFERLRDPLSSVMAQLSKPVRERAAFFIVDDFSAGVGDWVGAAALEIDPAGWAAVKPGLTLHGGTANLESYRLDFDAKIQSRAVGWVVRAPDTKNYYAFKLNQLGSRGEPKYSLVRYAMLDGAREAISKSVEVPAHLARAHDFNRISVRVINDKITTLINGWGVDYWVDDRLHRGGVGLLADRGEAALVRKMTISGNDDTWGLILYGTLESVRSVKDFFRGAGSAEPAMMIFGFRPPTIGTTADDARLLIGR